MDVQDFLNRNDVRIELGDDVRNAIGTDALIKTAALMNIVSGDPQSKAHC